MRAAWLAILGFAPAALAGGERSETSELLGQVGSRAALLVLHAAERADGGWQLAGEYVLLPTRARRFLEGERSPELGVTSLREGATPILFGRPPTGTLQGTWRDGLFRGTRYGPGGQERERFHFSEEFPSMEGYSANVRCELREGRYGATLAYAVEKGVLKSFEWRSTVAPGGHACAAAGFAQEPMRGGLRVSSGRCRVTLREVGEFIKLAAEDCAQFCGTEAWLEPTLVDRRGNCVLLHETRQP